jgi:hypothetical protein
MKQKKWPRINADDADEVRKAIDLSASSAASAEYEQRFSTVVTSFNTQCGP